MADFVPTICGTNSTYIPEAGCTDCDKLEERIEKLEQCCDEVKEELAKKLEAGDIEAGDGIIISINEETGKPIISTSREEILNVLGYEEIELSKTDAEGETVIAHVLGYITVEQAFEWTGLEPIEVESGEDFDPMDGVSAIGCNNEEATIELLSPTINGVSDWIMPLNGYFDPMVGITATGIDGVDEITYLVEANTDKLDTLTAGTYPVLYSITDENGNHAEETAQVTVLEEEQIIASFKVVANGTFNTEEIAVYYVDADGNQIVSQDEIPYMQIVAIPIAGTEVESTFNSIYAVKSLPVGVGMFDCDGEFYTDELTGTVDYDTANCIEAEITINNSATPYVVTLTATEDPEDEPEEPEIESGEDNESEGN